jgi:hypothetical protein
MGSQSFASLCHPGLESNFSTRDVDVDVTQKNNSSENAEFIE